MTNLKNKLNDFWQKCKAFLTKTYNGIPLYVYLLTAVVFIPLTAKLLLTKKKYK